jgi:hypothetical protein
MLTTRMQYMIDDGLRLFWQGTPLRRESRDGGCYRSCVDELSPGVNVYYFWGITGCGDSCNAKAVGKRVMQKFDPQLVQVMRNALEEVMTKVPLEYSTSSTKAYLAECILKAAAQGRTTFDELVVAAGDQIQSALSLFT